MKKSKEAKTDTMLVYLVPMLNLETNVLDSVPTILTCKDGVFLSCHPLENCEKYEKYGFLDEYFQWLLYTKYIKIKEDIV